MTNASRKAYSYIRFSSTDQAGGDSYRRQLAAAEEYCALNGLDLIDSKEYRYFDNGKSAFTGKHLLESGDFARFLSKVESGDIEPGSMLIVESLDRLSREPVNDALPRFLGLLKLGIDIYTTSDARLYVKGGNEIDLVVSIINMSRAHNESVLKSQRVSKAWQQKQKEARDDKKPLGSACPYWLKFNGDSYEVIPERVEVIRGIFKLAVSGHGHRAIAKKLNESKVSTFGSVNRNEKQLWASSSTGKILSNRALLGEYQPMCHVGGRRINIGDAIVNYYPVVISEDVYFEAQSARHSRRVSKATKPSRNYNVWQGIAKCGLCAESMHLVNKGQPPKGGKYLRCYGSAKGACTNKLIVLGQAEQAFLEVLAKVDSLSLVQDSQAKIQKEISMVELKIASVTKRQKEIELQIMELDGALPKLALLTSSKLEQESGVLNIRLDELKRDAQREKIINKQDFFDRVDLVTYEGRAKANQLLKALGVVVRMGRKNKDISYSVELDGVLSFVMEQTGSEISYYPYTSNISELITAQGDGAAFAEMHSSMVTRVFDLLALMKEHQRIQDMLASKAVIKKL
jgi:DNA invertase Pin-like site-specific DNA recombinase